MVDSHRGEVVLSVQDWNGRLIDIARSARPGLTAICDQMEVALESFSKGVARAGRNGRIDPGLTTELEALGLKLSRHLLGSNSEAFLGAIDGATRLQLCVVDQSLRVPWDFLAFETKEGVCFLGSFVVVTPQIHGSLSQGLRTSDEFDCSDLNGEFEVGLIEDDELDSATVDRTDPARAGIEEIRSFASLLPDLNDVRLLGPLDPAKPREGEVDTFQKWVAEDRRVVHFNCHGKPARGDDFPELQVSGRFRLTSTDIVGASAHNQDLRHGLVTLNVCRSAVGTYSSARTLSQLFHDQNAEAVVCTTGVVADWFATIFARELYSRLAATDLLSAIDETRKHLLRNLRQPMSLMYTFSGAGNFQPNLV